MGIGVSIFLIAIGAILVWAVHTSVGAVSLDTIGYILLGVGGLGLLMSLLVFGPRRRGPDVVEERVYHDRTY